MIVTFLLHRDRHCWWADWPQMRWGAAADTRDDLMRLCREAVAHHLMRPVAEHTLVFVDVIPEETCPGRDPNSGAACDKTARHHGTHGGIDRRGEWRHWS